MIRWQPALERPPPRTTAQPETAGLFYCSKPGYDSCHSWMRVAMSTLILIALAALLQIPSPEVPPAIDKSAAAHHNQSTKNNQDSTRGEGTVAHTHRATEKNATAKESDEDTQINRKLAAYTGALVWVGGIQIIVFVFQTGFMYKAFAETRKATNLTREALILTQRPKLIVRNIVIPELERMKPDTPNELLDYLLRGRFYVANVGGIMAEIREVHSQLYIVDNAALPMECPYESVAGSAMKNTWISPGTALPILMDQITLTVSDFAKIVHRLTSVYIMGFVLYSDDLGNVRQTAFCRRFNHESRRFSKVKDPDYEHAE
jgi:hypothetical protein